MADGLPPSTPSNRDWLYLHIRSLFVHDDRGRVVTRNALDGRRAPRFFLGRTPDGNRWRFRDDVPDAVAVQLETLCEDEPAPADLREPPLHDADYRRILATHGPIEETWAGPAYRFPEDLTPPGGDVVRLTEANAALLRGGDLEPWLADIGQSEPLMALVRDGRAVSVCGSVRITPEAHEAGVETSAATRGHGFAVAVVNAWAGAVRELGAEPLYSTLLGEHRLAGCRPQAPPHPLRRRLLADLNRRPHSGGRQPAAPLSERGERSPRPSAAREGGALLR